MGNIILNGSKRSLKNLSKVQRSIDRFLKSHPGKLSKRGHRQLRRLLKRRARALSKASGLKIYSVFE